MNEVELKPCPFCGQQAIRVSHPGTNWDDSEGPHLKKGAMFGLWYVGCPSSFFEGIVKTCGIAPAAKWFLSLSEAERHWNKRSII